MKKKSIVVFLLLSILLISSCDRSEGYKDIESQFSNSDWTYQLYYDYEIWHINSKTIVLGKLNSTFSLSNIIDSYISAFCYNKTYVVVERLPEGKGTENREYYILKMNQDELYGPYDSSKLGVMLSELDVTELGDWIITDDIPNRASLHGTGDGSLSHILINDPCPGKKKCCFCFLS